MNVPKMPRTEVTDHLSMELAWPQADAVATVTTADLERWGVESKAALDQAADNLRRLTSVSEGDLVRTFRMSLQLMRQLRRVLAKDDPLRDKLADAAALVDRDVVDARRQLELG